VVKDIRVMNLSLLAKWRWRLLEGENSLWKEVLEDKYGPCVGRVLEGDNSSWPRFASTWWKDLVKLGDFGEVGWFNAEVVRKVGNGMSTSFWNDKWQGDRCFRLKYPRLYMISSQREAMVGEVGVVTEDGREWNLSSRRRPFVWEEELILSLREDLEGFTWSLNEDVWRWKLDDNGVFSVKSAYIRLKSVIDTEDVWGEEEKRVFANLWKCPAPSKVVAFAWKALLNRVPTKANLLVRNVLHPDVSINCVLCNEAAESTNHLFLHCNFASLVWSRLMTWLNCHFVIPHNLFVRWECWRIRGGNKNRSRGLWLIWLTTIWILWRVRNDIIFKGITQGVDEVVEAVKVLEWRWVLERMKIPVCLFYEWCWDPIYCLGRVPIAP
jgi:hypothetical protein